MAIRRCPYCKAIIDEGSEYCSNCGTQLLFPEDENIQEEIPGEEVVEEEEPEEKPKKKKAFSRKQKKEEEEEEEPEETEFAEAEEAEEEEGAVSDEETEEQQEEIDHEDIAAEMLRKAEMQEKERPDEEEIPEEPQIEEEPPAEGEAPPEEEPTAENFDLPPGEDRDEYFVEEDKEASIKTEDLEKIIDPEEKEKAEIEKFLKSLKEDRGKWEGEIPPTDELPPWAEEIKEKQPEKPFGETEEEPLPVEEEQEEIVQEEDLPDREELHAPEMTPEEKTPEVELPLEEIQEKPPTEEEISMPDTGMGFPEGVEQERLPFDERPVEMFEEEKTSAARLPNWVKSRAFDALLIMAMWIVTIHIASRMMATNLFRLISVAALPVVAFYLVLLAAYLFMFFLFLGQTLGDHLFPHEE